MSALATDLFDYDLPADAIAQMPAAERDGSRLLVVDRSRHSVEHRRFRDLPDLLRAGDLLIRNDAAVLPARLSARRPTGGNVECFLLRAEGGEMLWRCLVKPGKKLPPGSTFSATDGSFRGEVITKDNDGTVVVRFETPNGDSIAAIAARQGDVPLPPYILRADSSQRDFDLERYQTLYADRTRSVAVAAPTAGLHFSAAILAELERRGVLHTNVTLHVGLGTFRPITAEIIEDHDIHREIYEIPAPTQASLGQATGRRIAVGTTSVRTIEDFLRRSPLSPAGDFRGEADIFIYPPYIFRGVDALITNFHQPRSTLLCLVAAFLAPGSTEGIPWLRDIYQQALAEKYRFLSYGDAMLIL